MEKYYYGIFTEEGRNTLVSIPDVEVCETFGSTFDEAYENAIDALAACLSVPETIIHKRTSRKALEKKYKNAQIIPVPVDQKIIKTYEASKRFNVIFPESLLREVDEFRAQKSLKRSQLLAVAVEKYMEENGQPEA